MKEKSKIVFFIGSMIIGGVEKSLIELLNTIDYDKYVVIVYLKNDNGDMRSSINSKAIIKFWGDKNTGNAKRVLLNNLCKLEVFQVFKGVYNRRQIRKYKKNYELNLLHSAKCMELIDDELYDCVIAYHGGDIQVVANSLYRMRAKKHILWVHGRDIQDECWLKDYDREYAKFDHVICVAESVRRFFKDQYPKAGKKTLVVHNCINSSEIREAANKSTDITLKKRSLLTVGRLSKEKGQDMIPKTSKVLRDMGYDVTWYLIGEGSLKEIIEKEIRRYGVENQVILLGAKTNPYPYMKQCEIYVQPSLTEGCCVAVQEAKVLHKPIVVTKDISFYEQITNKVTGVIAEGKSPKDLSVAIAELLDNFELREKIKNNLKKEEYSNQKEMQILYDILDQ